MKITSKDACQADLNALDAADQLTASVKAQINSFKDINPQTVIKKATKMLVTGNLSLEALGLSPQLFEQIEALEAINSVCRAKYRARVTADLHELDSIEEIDVEAEPCQNTQIQ